MHRNLIKSIGFLLLLVLNSPAFSQNLIDGHVYSMDDNTPLIGVNILEIGTDNGTITDLDGHFNLTLTQPTSQLQLSYLGYTDKVVDANSDLTTIFLEGASHVLDVAVVTGLNANRPKRAVGVSTEKMEGVAVLTANAPNLVSSMAGRMAGVNISQSSGVEGGSTRIVLRGANNITGNNQPLIIVDGVPLENENGFGSSNKSKDVSSGKDWGSAINNINPNDIASVDILKGANAAALYGARGKNGVILISLKKGEARDGFGIDYTLSHRVIQPYRFRNIQNKYGAGGPFSDTEPVFEKDINGAPIYPTQLYGDNGPGGVPTTQSFGFYAGSQSWGPEMDGTIIKWWDGELRPFSPQPDNIKLFYNNGYTTNHNLAFSGGSDNGTLRVSFSRADHKAIVPNSNYQQNVVNIGGVLKVSSKLKTDISINYIDYQRLNSPGLANDANNNFESGAVYSFPRSYKGLNFNYQNNDGTRKNISSWPYSYVSPYLVWNAYEHNTTLNRNKLLGRIGLTYQVNDKIDITGTVGLDNTNDDIITKRTPIDNTGLVIDDGSGGFYNLPVAYEKGFLNQEVSISEILISYKPNHYLKDKLQATYRLGGARWHRTISGIDLEGGRQLRDANLFTITNFLVGSPATIQDFPSVEESFGNKKINSIYGVADFNFEDYLYLQITARNDWNSALPINNNSYLYPSANLSFVVSEKFRDKIPHQISHLKARFALSRTADDNELSQGQLVQLFDSKTFNGNVSASLQNEISPFSLQPAIADSWETGIEFGLFEDKLTADLTYYFIDSRDQLLESPTPASSGFSAIRINTGRVQNKGLEATLRYTKTFSQDLLWKTSINYARNNNKLISLGEGAELLELSSIWGQNGPSISVKAGESLGTIVGFDYVRHPESGQKILTDDGLFYKLTDNQVPIKIYDDSGNFLRIANSTPKFTGGWHNEISWKSFSLSALVDVKWGGDMWFGSHAIGLQSGQSLETLKERDGGGLPYLDEDGITRNVGLILPGVYSDGTTNDKVVHYYYKYLNQGGWGKVATTPAVMENSWIKMRQLQLSYQVSERIVKKSKLFQNLIITLTGRDLFFLYDTAPDNINPEGNITSGNGQGLEFASLPGSRSYGITLQASF